jgi:hypothetical protein
MTKQVAANDSTHIGNHANVLTQVSAITNFITDLNNQNETMS